MGRPAARVSSAARRATPQAPPRSDQDVQQPPLQFAQGVTGEHGAPGPRRAQLGWYGHGGGQLVTVQPPSGAGSTDGRRLLRGAASIMPRLYRVAAHGAGPPRRLLKGVHACKQSKHPLVAGARSRGLSRIGRGAETFHDLEYLVHVEGLGQDRLGPRRRRPGQEDPVGAHRRDGDAEPLVAQMLEHSQPV